MRRHSVTLGNRARGRGAVALCAALLACLALGRADAADDAIEVHGTAASIRK